MKKVADYSTAAQVWALRHYGEAGPRTFRALLAHFGNLVAILEAELEEIQEIDGLGENRSQRIFDSFKSLEKAEDFIGTIKEREIGYSTFFDEDYPVLFMELNDPPPIIFYRGHLPAKGEKTVAIIGSHDATIEGIKNAVDLSGRLAGKSVSIVSGLARGIDASAHIGAMKAGGKTYGVIGTGFDNIYPEENRPLAAEMIKIGGLISEYPPEAGYAAGRFTARNRLTAGLSQAVIIGELFSDSTGTLDTAAFCHDLGKLMFVLVEGYDVPHKDKGGVEKVLAKGAIPITLENGIDIILKSLV